MTAEGHLLFSIACAVFAKNAELTPVLAQGDWWHIVPSAILTCLFAQRWADSGTVNAGERRNDSPISTNATYLPRSIQTSRNESIFIACSGGAGSVRGT